MNLIHGNNLENLYELIEWTEDPYTEEGSKRFNAYRTSFSKLVKHKWIQEMTRSKKQISILEICGGTGIAGTALAKILKDEGMPVDLTVTDIRSKALSIAEKWGSQVLGKVNVSNVDARAIGNLNRSYDMIVMLGNSSVYFDPWNMISLLSAANKALTDSGLLIIEDVDFHRLMLIQGYKDLLIERIDGAISLSFDRGYNPTRGTYERIYFSMPDAKKKALGTFHFWSIAELAALVSIFYEKSDVIEHPSGKSLHFFICGYKPRKELRQINMQANEGKPETET